MKKYELLDHTADAKFRAYGKTKEEAFTNAVLGMTAIVAEPEKLGHAMTFPLVVKAKNLKSLLFDMLDEILFLHDTEKFIPATAHDLRITELDGMLHLHATLVGDDSRKWQGNLKAVTYSEMLVEQLADKTWVLQAVIDI